MCMHTNRPTVVLERLAEECSAKDVVDLVVHLASTEEAIQLKENHLAAYLWVDKTLLFLPFLSHSSPFFALSSPTPAP